VWFRPPRDPDVAVAVAQDFMRHLATWHATPARKLELPSFGSVRSVRDHQRDQLAGIEALFEREDRAQPIDLLARAQLEYVVQNVPDYDDEPVVVQGDTGPGTFLHDGHRVTAVLDFELAHLGDPMEDLAWIGTRNAQEPVPDFLGLVRDYEAGGGAPVDVARIRYHFVFAELRIAVLATERRGLGPTALGDVGNQLIYGMLHTRLTAEALATAVGVELPEVAVDEAHDTEYSAYFDAVLEQLRDVVSPAIGDAFALQRTKSAARVVKYLREVDRYGSRPAEAELDAMERLLGERPGDVDAGRARLAAAERDGQLDAVALLDWAWSRIRYDQARMASSMGVLATRHLPVLPEKT
jgi:hypothetical protein